MVSAAAEPAARLVALPEGAPVEAAVERLEPVGPREVELGSYVRVPHHPALRPADGLVVSVSLWIAPGAPRRPAAGADLDLGRRRRMGPGARRRRPAALRGRRRGRARGDRRRDPSRARLLGPARGRPRSARGDRLAHPLAPRGSAAGGDRGALAPLRAPGSRAGRGRAADRGGAARRQPSAPTSTASSTRRWCARGRTASSRSRAGRWARAAAGGRSTRGRWACTAAASMARCGRSPASRGAETSMTGAWRPSSTGRCASTPTPSTTSAGPRPMRVELPASLRSGVYALELEAGGVIDRVPVAVRRPPGARRRRAPSCCRPSPTWPTRASAPSRRGVGSDEPEDRWVAARGLRSLYDRHADGGGVCEASWLRPLTQMRPGYRCPQHGGPHGLAQDLILLGWLARQGIEYEVLTDHDLDREGAGALASRTLITGAHPEYASAAHARRHRRPPRGRREPRLPRRQRPQRQRLGRPRPPARDRAAPDRDQRPCVAGRPRRASPRLGRARWRLAPAPATRAPHARSRPLRLRAGRGDLVRPGRGRGPRRGDRLRRTRPR